MIKIIIGLICVMLANIILGSSIAKLKKEWNISTFLNGLSKAGFIVLGAGLMYLCGHLNPNVLSISIDNQSYNIIDAMRIMFISGIVYYSGKDITKLRELLKIPTKEESKTESQTGLG
jgi:hypothetical protein